MRIFIYIKILLLFLIINNLYANLVFKNYVDVDERIEIIDEAFTKIGLDQYESTRPEIIKSLFKETHLDTFKTSVLSLQEHFNKMTTSPQDLKPLLNNIKNGIANNDPVFELIKTGVEKNWFIKNDYIKRSTHMLYIFEFLTLAASNNVTFLKELQGHFLDERKKFGIDSKKIINTFFHVGKQFGKFFESAKLLSVDPAITCAVYERQNGGQHLTKEEVNDLFKQKAINILEKNNMTPTEEPGHNLALQTNIMEASITEFNKGYKDNAFAGYSLIHSLILNTENYYFENDLLIPDYYDYNQTAKLLGNENNFYTVNELSKKWVDLYTSWNAAFVVAELNDLHLLLPKLFIPAQINTRSEVYIFKRVITLWNAINFTLFRSLDKVPAVEGPSNKDEIVKEWGKINKKYAKKYLEEELDVNSINFEKKFNKDFSRRYWILFNMMKHFFKS